MKLKGTIWFLGVLGALFHLISYGNQNLEQGKVAYQNNDFKEAIRLFESSYEAEKKAVTALYLATSCYQFLRIPDSEREKCVLENIKRIDSLGAARGFSEKQESAYQYLNKWLYEKYLSRIESELLGDSESGGFTFSENNTTSFDEELMAGIEEREQEVTDLYLKHFKRKGIDVQQIENEVRIMRGTTEMKKHHFEQSYDSIEKMF